MRQVTVTEKYRAVLEGKMAKGEFVRQMRLAHPQHITQFNGFDDSVQILKNRGLLFEAPKVEVVEEEVKQEPAALPYNDEAFQRGIRYELEAKGIEVHAGTNIKLEDYDAAKDAAHKNLSKDPLHYLNLISGESSKVDKHDKEVPVKRGEGKVDVFNGLKKANLKENKEEFKALLKEGKLEDLAKRLGVPLDRLMAAADKIRDMEREKAQKDALKLSKMKEVIDEEEVDETEAVAEGDGHMVDEHEHQFFKIAFEGKYDDILEDYMSSNTYKEDERELQDKHDVSSAHDVKFLDEWENYIKEYEAINRSDAADTYNFQEKKVNVQELSPNNVVWNWSGDRNELEQVPPDFKAAVRAGLGDQIDDEDFEDAFDGIKNFFADEAGRGSQTFNSDHWVEMIEMDYLQEKKGKDHDGDGDIDSDDYMAAKDKAIKKAMGKDVDEALDSLMAEDSKTMSKRELAPHYAAAAKEAGFSDEQTKKAFDLISRFMDKRAKGRRLKFVNYGWAGYEDLYKNLADKLNKADGGGWEVKNQGSWYGDGSGWQVVKIYPYDNTSEKAMGKDEQLKEAIKKIIKESLLKEAATAKLSDIGDKYGDYKGMQVVINDLENIVTDMEGYFAKTRERVQNAMDKIGQVETPDGMKVGAFLAPAIETAFFKDLNPVRKLSHRDIKLPQVKVARFDDLQREAEAEIAPKETVFGVNEKK